MKHVPYGRDVLDAEIRVSEDLQKGWIVRVVAICISAGGCVTLERTGTDLEERHPEGQGCPDMIHRVADSQAPRARTRKPGAAKEARRKPFAHEPEPELPGRTALCMLRFEQAHAPGD